MQVVPSKGEGETATAPNSDRSDRAAPPEDSGKRRTADNTHAISGNMHQYSLPLINYTKLIRIAPANTARSVSNPRKRILYKITVSEVSGTHALGIESLKFREYFNSL